MTELGAQQSVRIAELVQVVRASVKEAPQVPLFGATQTTERRPQGRHTAGTRSPCKPRNTWCSPRRNRRKLLRKKGHLGSSACTLATVTLRQIKWPLENG